MSLSITFKHIASKVKKWLIWLHVPCFSYQNSCLKKSVCLLGLKFHDLGTQTQKKPECTVYLSNFTKFLWYLTVMQTPLLCIQTFFLFVELFDTKVLLIRHAVTQIYVFVVFQSEATDNNSYD